MWRRLGAACFNEELDGDHAIGCGVDLRFAQVRPFGEVGDVLPDLLVYEQLDAGDFGLSFNLRAVDHGQLWARQSQNA